MKGFLIWSKSCVVDDEKRWYMILQDPLGNDGVATLMPCHMNRMAIIRNENGRFPDDGKSLCRAIQEKMLVVAW